MDKDKQIQFLKDSHDAMRELAYQTGVRDEREACAQICDVLSVLPIYASPVTKLAAAAIRARGEK